MLPSRALPSAGVLTCTTTHSTPCWHSCWRASPLGTWRCVMHNIACDCTIRHVTARLCIGARAAAGAARAAAVRAAGRGDLQRAHGDDARDPGALRGAQGNIACKSEHAAATCLTSDRAQVLGVGDACTVTAAHASSACKTNADPMRLDGTRACRCWRAAPEAPEAHEVVADGMRGRGRRTLRTCGAWTAATRPTPRTMPCST